MKDKAREVAARGMVPQGPEDVAGKNRRVGDQHQVKQDRRCIEAKADLHSGTGVHHVVTNFNGIVPLQCSEQMSQL